MKKLFSTLLIVILLCCISEYVVAAWGGEGAFGSIINYLKHVGTNIIPSKDSTYDLGSALKKWKDAYFDTTIIGDITTSDSTPSLGFDDTDSNVGYMWHLDSAEPNWANFQLWRGTYSGTTFSVNPDKPLIQFDNSNNFIYQGGTFKTDTITSTSNGAPNFSAGMTGTTGTFSGDVAVNGGDFTSTADTLRITPVNEIDISQSKISISKGNAGGIWVDSNDNVWQAFNVGLRKSTDKGVTWVTKDAIGQTVNVSGVFQASNGYFYWCPWGSGLIRRSIDGGETWTTEFTFTAANRGIWNFTEDTSGGLYDGYLYCGQYTTGVQADNAIWRSIDNGDTWTVAKDLAGDGHVHIVAADPYTGYVYATAEGGAQSHIWRSIDGGANWTDVMGIVGAPLLIEINFIPGTRFFAADANGYVYKTTDDAAYTESFFKPTGWPRGFFSSTKLGSKIFFGQVVVGAAGEDAYRIISTIDGTHWNVEWQGTSTTQWDGIRYLSNPDSDGNIYVSINGASDNDFRFNSTVKLTSNNIESNFGALRLGGSGSSDEDITIDFRKVANTAVFGSTRGVNNWLLESDLQVDNYLGSANILISHIGGSDSSIKLGTSNSSGTYYPKAGIFSIDNGTWWRQDLVLSVDTAADVGTVASGDAKLTISGATGNVTIANDLAVDGGDITSTGDLTLDPAGSDILIDGGLTVGSTTQAGDNNLRVEGTSALVGDVTCTGDIAVNGGDITTTGDLTLDPAGNDVTLDNSDLIFNAANKNISATTGLYIDVDVGSYEAYYTATAITHLKALTQYVSASLSNTTDYATMSLSKPNAADGKIATSSLDILIDPAGNDLIIDATGPNYAADAVGNDAYAITLTGITIKTGMVVYFNAQVANVGACSLNVNAVGAVSLKSLHDQDPPDNYIEAGSIVQCVYDGTNWQILSPDANP